MMSAPRMDSAAFRAEASPVAGSSGASAVTTPVNWRLILAGALALAVLFTIQNSLTPPASRAAAPVAELFLHQVVIWGSWVAVMPLIFAVARRWRAAKRFTISSCLVQLVLSIAIAMLQGLIAGLTRWLLGIALSPDLGVVFLNSVGTYPGSGLLRYWLIALAYHAVAHHHEVRERDVDAARLETRLAEAKLEALQGRLHPHFLFNTLNSIGALIRLDPPAAERMLEDLGELLRESLSTETSLEGSLDRELELVRRYVAIQKMRYRERLHVTIDVPADLRNLRVPHLILQPLVENAIRHGLAPREEGGRVRIHASRQANTLVLAVEDDGVGLDAGHQDASASSSGIGLNGTRARLMHLYGTAASLDIRATGRGTVVTVTLPADDVSGAGAPA